MKTSSILGALFAFVLSTQAFAVSGSYCDDITRLDNLWRLTSDQFKNAFIDGQKIDRMVVSKDRRILYALNDDVVIKSYRVAFGSSPFGHKQFEGDQKTPEGIYTIDSKNPNSKFYRALHVSYPNKQDRDYAKSKGRSPGGDIMVHGLPVDPNKRSLVEFVHPGFNWTAGCIAVTDSEIDELYKMVDRGVTIEICKMTPAPIPPPIDPGDQTGEGDSGGGSIYLPGK